MSDHTHTRLETLDGDVVMYLAPVAEYNPVYQNDVESNGLPNDRAPIARDFGLWTGEYTLQGELESSDALPVEHEDDLVALDSEWSRPVTARQQINRMTHYFMDVGGPFVLIDGDDEYRATSNSEVNMQRGVFPAVIPTEWKPPRNAGFSRVEYTAKFKIGVER